MLDITATVEKRRTLVDVTKRVAEAATVPFTMGGGIRSLADAEAVLSAGADRFSVSSAAFRDPALVGEMVAAFGAVKVTVAIDVAQNAAMPSGYEVFVDGGRTATGADAIEFARRALDAGATCLLPTSKSTDGARTGFDLPLIRGFRAVAPDADIVASGGAGTMEHFAEAAEAGANVLLGASVFHFGTFSIRQVKEYMAGEGIPVRLDF
jgi:cyclase